jgi:hypothetical protein
MQILFIDESGTPPPQTKIEHSPYFVLGGVVIPENFWHYVKQDLAVAKRRFGVFDEVKWRYFAPPPPNAKPHSLSHLSPEKKEALRSELFGIIRKYKSIKIISVVTDIAHAYAVPYLNTPDDIFWYTYKQITERFQYYLQDISRISGEKTNGIIVCDHRAPNDDRRLQELHGKLLRGTKESHSSYSHLIEGVFIAPSHLSVGIQFADMVAGATLRKFKDNDDRFYSQIEASFRRSTTGEVGGYGLVQFPPRK